jgi:hypothetical protein
MPAPGSRPSFAIPQRPERRFSRSGGLSYEGTTVFVLTPEAVPENVPDPNEWLYDRLEGVLDGGPYRYGDWFDLPMPVLLVHDRETGDVFRVAIRDGSIEFHVLPDTDSEGLATLYERLCGASEDATENDDGETDGTWRVECRTGGDS